MDDRIVSSGYFIRSATTVVAMVLLTWLCHASPLSDYASRLEAAQKDVDNMSQALTNGESGEEVKFYLRQTIARLLKTLPQNEKVQNGGGETDVANGWLKIKLDEFE